MFSRNINIVEGASYGWHLNLLDAEGEPLDALAYDVYGGVWSGNKKLTVTSALDEYKSNRVLVTLPADSGLYSGVGWNYQIMVRQKETGLEWPVLTGSIYVVYRGATLEGDKVTPGAEMYDVPLSPEEFNCAVTLYTAEVLSSELVTVQEHMADESRHVTDSEREKLEAMVSFEDVDAAIVEALYTRSTSSILTLVGTSEVEARWLQLSADFSPGAGAVDEIMSLSPGVNGDYQLALWEYVDDAYALAGVSTSMRTEDGYDIWSFADTLLQGNASLRICPVLAGETWSDANTLVCSYLCESFVQADGCLIETAESSLDGAVASLSFNRYSYSPVYAAVGDASSGGDVDLSGYVTTTSFASHTSDTTSHITSSERTSWNAKLSTSDLPAASTSTAGVVKISSNYMDTSTTTAATPYAVYSLSQVVTEHTSAVASLSDRLAVLEFDSRVTVLNSQVNVLKSSVNTLISAVDDLGEGGGSVTLPPWMDAIEGDATGITSIKVGMNTPLEIRYGMNPMLTMGYRGLESLKVTNAATGASICSYAGSPMIVLGEQGIKALHMESTGQINLGVAAIKQTLMQFRSTSVDILSGVQLAFNAGDADAQVLTAGNFTLQINGQEISVINTP